MPAVQYWNIWKIECFATRNLVVKKLGMKMSTRYCLFKKDSECLQHVIWHYRFSSRIWAWVVRIFDLHPSMDLAGSYTAATWRSRMIKYLCLAANLVVCTEL